nr:Crp/Fnr family transcriptional regulator [uncultured Shimia sp.]
MTKSKKTLDHEADPLDRIGWLSQCSGALRAWFVDNGRWLEVPAGASLFHDGDDTDGMYGIGAGAVDLEFAPEGMESLVTFRMPPGGWLGHGSLLPDMPRPFNLVAAVDSEIYYVPSKALRRFVKENPEFWPEFYSLTIQQILALMTFVGELQSLPPEARLARQLLRLSSIGTAIEVRQNDLTATLGISKSSVRRALTSLVDSGAILTRYNRIDVVDRRRLEIASLQKN